MRHPTSRRLLQSAQQDFYEACGCAWLILLVYACGVADLYYPVLWLRRVAVTVVSSILLHI